MEIFHVHTESKTRDGDAIRQRLLKAVIAAAPGTSRFMPVLHRGRCIAWAGWSEIRKRVLVLDHKPWMRTWVDRNGLLCGFTSVDDLINNVTTNGKLKQSFWFKSNFSTALLTNHWLHYYVLGGWPAGGTFSGTALTARAHDDTDPGAIMHGGNVSTATKHIISGWVRSNSVASVDAYTFVVYDMVITYDNCVMSSASQPMVNVTTAGRYIGGSDPGLQIMGCQSNAWTANTSYTNIKYTNIASTAGQLVATPSLTTPVNNVTPGAGTAAVSAMAVTVTNVRSILSPALQNGDSGVKQIDSFQMGALNTQTTCFILGFQLAWMPCHGGIDNVYANDFVKMGDLCRVRDGACLTVACYSPTASQRAASMGLNFAWA